MTNAGILNVPIAKNILMKHRFFTIVIPCLTASVLGSCIFLPFSQLSMQCQQKASYVYYRMAEPKVAALRIVDKRGVVLLEPEMTRPKVQQFASILSDYAGIRHSHEFAGNIRVPHDAEGNCLYIEMLDADDKQIERFVINEELDVTSDSFLLRYYCKGITHGCPLAYALTQEELDSLRKHFSHKK